MERVEKLLKVGPTLSLASSPSVHGRRDDSRDETVDLLDIGPSYPIEYSKVQSNINSQEKDTDQSPYERGSFGYRYGDIGSMTAKSDCTPSDQDRSNGDKKGIGSLVVNEVGDLQYLGKKQINSSPSHQTNPNDCLPYAGPASGFAVLSQAAELLDNGETIHQQLHMSGFDSSEKERLVDSGIRLPPKEVADRYMEGQFIDIELSLFR
jgi:hypothetical protein